MTDRPISVSFYALSRESDAFDTRRIDDGRKQVQ